MKGKNVLIETIDIKTIPTAEQGSLSFFEAERDIPFEIKRLYYTHGVPEGVQRGGHAHHKLDQVLFCPYGRIEVVLYDGRTHESVMLDQPNMGLIVRSMMWHDMVWHASGSVLVVAASDYYRESDYIRNHEEFIRLCSLSEHEEG